MNSMHEALQECYELLDNSDVRHFISENLGEQSRLHSALNKARKALTTTTKTWGVWCTISGGVTGRRQAWLKSGKNDGSHRVFATYEDAKAEADRLNHLDRGPHITCRYHYEPREMT